MVCTARQIGHHASLERIAAMSKVVEHTHPSTTIAIGLACGTARRRWKQEIIEVGNALARIMHEGRLRVSLDVLTDLSVRQLQKAPFPPSGRVCF